jgi:hypothetical protein
MALRTTIRLTDSLLEKAKREAARRGETLTSLIEQGLRLVLVEARPPRRNPPLKLPICRAGGGPLPGVDLNDTSALLDRMEARR